MIFRDYFRWKLPDLKVNFTLPLTFWRYVTFACPDPWEGMAWFLPVRRTLELSF